MIKGHFNIVMDGGWGSSGKGKVCSALAKRYGVTDASSCNMPNAGHTVEINGERNVYKVLPAASHFGADAWIGPGAVFDKNQIQKEVLEFAKCGSVRIHPRAGVLQPEHAEIERQNLSVISSTMQGSGAALAEKIMRKAHLAQQELAYDGDVIHGTGEDFRREFRDAVRGGMVLHEVAQGWGLSLDHGTHYPHCTSRNCGVGRALDDMAIPASLVGDVYLVMRSLPIRVGNTADGYSGDWLPDQEELTWEEVERRTGLSGLAEKERTTVTKRIRRVATFSWQLLKDAVESNGVTKIVATFPEYLGRDKGIISKRAWDWIWQMQKYAPVVAISTGPDTNDMIWRD